MLAGFLFNEHKDNQKDLEKYKKEIRDCQEKLKLTEFWHSIYARVVSIYLESQNFKKIILANNQELSDDSWEVVYRMYRKTRAIQLTIQKKKLDTISYYYKNEIVVVIKDTIDTIDFKKIISANSMNNSYFKGLETILN